MVAENEIDWNVPLSWIVPLESFRPRVDGRVGGAADDVPATVSPGSPLMRVMLVPAGNVSVVPSEPRSMTGSVVGAPKSSVYDVEGANTLNDRWSPSVIGGVNSDSESRLLVPSIVDPGGSWTAVPENVTV